MRKSTDTAGSAAARSQGQRRPDCLRGFRRRRPVRLPSVFLSPGSYHRLCRSDVAKAHIEALVRPAAGGNRFVVSRLGYSWQQVLDIVHETEAGKIWPDTPKGKPGAPIPGKVNTLDATKSKKELGLQVRRPFAKRKAVR